MSLLDVLARRADIRVDAAMDRVLEQAARLSSKTVDATVQLSSSDPFRVWVVPVDSGGAAVPAQNETGSVLVAGQRVRLEYRQKGAFVGGFAHIHHGVDLIQSQTLTAVAATVTFAVPTGYQGLQLTILARSSIAALAEDMGLRVNGDAGAADYTHQRISGVAATPSAASAGDDYAKCGTVPGATATASRAGLVTVTIPRYSETTFNKIMHIIGGRVGSASAAEMLIAERHSTAAITSLVVRLDGGGSFIAGSAFDLYGLS